MNQRGYMDSRIRRGVALKACVCMALLLPATAFADVQQRYFDVMSRYYHLDQQPFTEITCKLEVEPMRGVMEKTRQMLAGMSDKLKMTDTLDQYQLVYSKSTGIRFNDPSMSVTILSEQGMADPARVREGMAQMEQGFKNEVQGTDTQLQGLFEGYETPKKSDITVDAADVNADGAVLKYKKKGAAITDTIRGPDMHTMEAIPNGSMTADSSYKDATGNKLILDKFDMKMDQAIQTLSMHGAITYQSLDGILFPQEIEEHGVIENMQNMKTEFTVTVKFMGCQLRK